MSETSRPAPIAQGTLEKRPLAHLIAYARERRLTGSLVFGPVDLPLGVVVVRDGEPRKADAFSADVWDGLAALQPSTAFAYFERWDALPKAPEAPVSTLYGVIRVLRRQPPSEHMKHVLTRLGAGQAVIPPEVRLDTSGFDAREAAAFDRLRSTPFSLDTLNAEPVLGSEAEIILYALLITKLAQPTAGPAATGSSTDLAGSDSSQRMVAASQSAPDATVPPAAPSSSESVPDSSEKQISGAAVGRVKLKRNTQPRLKEERSVISSTDSRASLPPVPMAPAVDWDARRKEIVERAKAIDTLDYFAMLGVAQDTPTAQIQIAFLALAKKWHPDRLPPELKDVREQCARVFARLSEASTTLTDDEQRVRYLRLLDEGGATPEDQEKIASVLEAATSFQKAEVMMKRGDMARALEFCTSAVHLDAQPDYVALLAWLESQSPNHQGTEDQKRFEAKLSSAIEKSDRCERAYFYRGNVRKKIGDISGAVDDFRRAFELNPRNLDAQREVRLFDMRAQKELETSKKASEPPRRPSLIGRLFKK